MSWLEAIDGSIKKWEGIRDLVDSKDFCEPEQFKKVKKLVSADCPICKFRDSSVKRGEVCDDCIISSYFGSVCGYLDEWENLKLELRSDPDWVGRACQTATKAAVDDILRRLGELKYWLVNVRG